MTDIFQRLAARAQGTERQLRPQVQGLFEPQGYDSDDGGFIEVSEETTAGVEGRRPADRAKSSPATRHRPAAPPQAPAAGRPAATGDTSLPQASAAPSIPGSPPSSDDSPARPEVSGEATAPGAPRSPIPLPPGRQADGDSPAPPRGTTTRVAGPQPAAADAARVTTAEDEAESRDLAARSAQKRDSPPPSGHQAAGPNGPGRRARQTGETDGARAPLDRTGEPDGPGLPARPLRPLAAPRRLAEAGDAAFPAWRPAAGRQVHIHIDHIEVRQQTKAAAEPARRSRPANPAPDLNDYLRRRRS